MSSILPDISKDIFKIKSCNRFEEMLSITQISLTLTKMSKYQDFLILEAHWIRSKNMEDVNKKVFVKDKGAIF